MRKYYPYFLLTLLVLISYGQSLNFYFWHDDYTVFYYLQQNTKIWFPFHAYYYLGQPLYNLFALNPFGYHLTGIVLYSTAAALLYILIRRLINNQLVAFLSSSIFAAGYVGQEAMKMYVSVGTTLFLGLNTFLLTLIFLPQNLFFSLVFFFLTIELAPHRYPGLIIAVFAMDWLINRKIKLRKMSAFVVVFLVQYIFKPTQLIFLYPLTSPGTANKVDDLITRDLVSLLQSLFSIETISRSFGTIWNLFFPTVFQTEYFFFLSRSLPSYLEDQVYLLISLPSVLFSILLIILLRKKIVFRIIIFLLVSYGWTIILSKTSQFSLEQIAVANGGVLTFLFLLTLFANYRRKIKYFLFCIFIIISTIGVVIFFNSSSILESDHRYLFPATIIPSLLVLLFFNGKMTNVAFAFSAIVFTITHLIASVHTQKEFIQNYSQDSKAFFGQLQQSLKNINQKVYVSFEGTSKENSHKIADSMRVGAMPSEASVAVHLNRNIDSIVLLDNTSQANEILVKQAKKTPEQFYRFIYDGNLLRDISEGFRRGLINPMNEVVPKDLSIEVKPLTSLVSLANQMVKIKTTYYNNEKYTLGIYPNVRLIFNSAISSQLQLEVKMKILAKVDNQVPIPYLHMHYAPHFVFQPNIWQEVLSWRKGECIKNRLHFFECIRTKDELLTLQNNKTGEIEFVWEYDTFGSVGNDKFHKARINFDGINREYTFVVPAGGEYLRSLSINYVSLPSLVEISDISFSTSK